MSLRVRFLLTALGSAGVALALSVFTRLHTIEQVLISIVFAWMLSVFLSEQPLETIARLRRRVIRIKTGDHSEQSSMESGDAHFDALAKDIAGCAAEIQKLTEEYEHRIEVGESITDDLADAVIAVDAAGRIVKVNPSAGLFFGVVPHSDMIGKTVMEATLNHLLDEVVRKTLQTKQPQEGFVDIHSPKERSVSITTIPRVSAQSVLTSAIIVLHDMTAIKQVERMRKDFVANASHELRTPVTSIQVMAESLMGGAMEDPELGPKFLSSISDSAIRLMHLVDDLLYLNVQESHQEENLEDVDVTEVVREAVEKLQPQAKARRVVLESDLISSYIVRADRLDIWRAAANLIDNAIRYCDPGDRVDVWTEGDERDVRIIVKDTGIGIPAAHQEKIFERFYRVDPARSRESGGTGLGLSIVKHIVESHGGRVSVESQIGLGSEFTITLPRLIPGD